jgi:hypothetical protein
MFRPGRAAGVLERGHNGGLMVVTATPEIPCRDEAIGQT